VTAEPLDMTASITPRSDQLNAEDLLTGPVTVTITDVTRGSTEQPVNIVTAEFGAGRPYKPSKTMRRMIVAAWGPDSSAYIGRRLTIYRDPDITFGKDRVGGIRISHMSHLSKRLEIALTVTRGRRAQFAVDPLPDDTPPKSAAKTPSAAAIADAFKAFGVTLDQLEARIGYERDQWTAADITSLAALGKAIKAGETTVYEEFDT
jgi:hypothetical protein